MPNVDTLLAGLELGPSYAFRDWPNPAVPMLAAGVYTIWRQDELIYVGMAGRSLWARASYRLQLILHVVRPAATTATMQLRAANEGAAMLYSYLVGKLVRQSFDHVNNHRWDELLKPVAPNVHHRFGGSHSIGGERHDKEAMRRWLERLGRVLPNLHLEVNKIWVTGWPWETTVFVQWDATATLLNGDKSYFNRGLHVISMRWGTAYALDVFEDSQEVARGLAAQAAAGLKEAVAEQIGS